MSLSGSDPSPGLESSENATPGEALPVDYPATSGTETAPVPLSSQPDEGTHEPAAMPEPDAEPGAVTGAVGAGAAQAPLPQAAGITSDAPEQVNAGETSGSSPAIAPGAPLATPEDHPAEPSEPAPDLPAAASAGIAAQDKPAAAFIPTASGADVAASPENRTELEAAQGGNPNFQTGYVGGAVAEVATQSALLDDQRAGQRSPEAQGLQPELHGAQGSTAPFGGGTATLEHPRKGKAGQDLPEPGPETDPDMLDDDVYVRSGTLLDGTHYACANCGLPRYVHSVINARCPTTPDEPYPPPPPIPPAGLTVAAQTEGRTASVTVHAAHADVGLDWGDGSAVDEIALGDADENGDVHAEHEYGDDGDYTVAALSGQESASAVVHAEGPPASAPTLSKIDPSTGAEMATTDVTLTGTGFTSPGATPQTSSDGTSWEDAEWKASPAVTDTSGKVAIDTSAAGVVKIRVNSDAGASPSKDFTVNAPAQSPTLSAIAPTSAEEA